MQEEYGLTCEEVNSCPQGPNYLSCIKAKQARKGYQVDVETKIRIVNQSEIPFIIAIGDTDQTNVRLSQNYKIQAKHKYNSQYRRDIQLPKSQKTAKISFFVEWDKRYCGPAAYDCWYRVFYGEFTLPVDFVFDFDPGSASFIQKFKPEDSLIRVLN